MKKKILLIIILIILIELIIGYTTFFYNKKIEPFYLEEKYYAENVLEEKDYNSINEIIKNKESFVLFIYQSSSVSSAEFESILQGFLKENQLKILKVAFSEVKDTKIGKKITFYPSFIIFEKGKMISYIDNDNDADRDIFSSKEEFKNWLTKYVKLKDIEVNDNGDDVDDYNKTEEDKNTDIDIENINLDYINKDNGKINIYLFWGDGCPHCKNEKDFFESIQNEYGELYNLYLFETWYDKENQKVLNAFSNAMNEQVSGVPYTIIGNKTFTGFGDNSKEELISAITNPDNKGFDVYFDIIKKNNSTQS